jgi:NitT/TauT family transport system permease protein
MALGGLLVIRQPITYRQRVAFGILAWALVAIGYTWLSYQRHVENPLDTTMPTWVQIWDGVRTVTEYQEFDEHRWIVADFSATGLRLLLGLIPGIGLAIVIGVLMGCYGSVRAFFEPLFVPVGRVPGTAMMVAFFVLVGTGTSMYAAMIMFGVLPPLALAIMMAVDDVPPEYSEHTYTIGGTNTEVIWNTILPTILPSIIGSIRLQLGIALTALIAAESLVGGIGLGYRLRMEYRAPRMSTIYVYLVILAVIGLLSDNGLIRLRGRLSRWYQRNGES